MAQATDVNRRAALGLAASLPKTMRAYELGDAAPFRLVERPLPIPAAGEVLVKVNATGINARDLRTLSGEGPRGRRISFVPLTDNACRIVSLSPGVTGWNVGQRVMVSQYWDWPDGKWDPMTRDIGANIDGMLREYAAVPVNMLVALPDSISDIDAASLSIAGLTAWRSVVVEGQVQPGETVVTLGTGGVSIFDLQIAKIMGARVIVTSSSDDKLERAKALGADMTVNYRTFPEWDREILKLTNGSGADVVVNTIGYPELERCMRVCATNARVIHVGAAREVTTMKPLANMLSMVSIKGISNGSRRHLQDFVRAVAANGLKPVIDRVFPFLEAQEAVRYMEGPAGIGKVMISVS